LLKTEKFKEAETIFQGLTKQYPEQPQYSSALAKTALDARDFNTAVLRYQKLTEQFPDNSAIKLEFINALLKVDKADLARKYLLALSPEEQQMTIYWGLLAEAYNKNNQPAESHRYLAEYYFAMGQTRDAIYQIRLALESKGLSFQLSSILSDRLNFFQNQEQEAKANR
jgi:predicted Zn-dependent protease